MFDAGQGALDQSDSFTTGEQFGRSAIPQDYKRRGQPVRRLPLVSENGHRMSDHRHKK
jgi:hypothetical protein